MTAWTIQTDRWVRRRAIEFLDELRVRGGASIAAFLRPGESVAATWDWLPESAVKSPTGLVLIDNPDRQVALSPPFQLGKGTEGDPDLSLRDSLTRPRLIGVLLLRLGHYSVGVTDGTSLLAAKSGARYVHGRHRAGGQSQRRWERNREQWIEKMFDEVCAAWHSACGGFSLRLEGLALGGDRIVLGRFFKHCEELSPLADRIVVRRVNVERPGRRALERAVEDVWTCIVYRRDLADAKTS